MPCVIFLSVLLCFLTPLLPIGIFLIQSFSSKTVFLFLLLPAMILFLLFILHMSLATGASSARIPLYPTITGGLVCHLLFITLLLGVLFASR